MPDDHRDLAIKLLADTEAELREEVDVLVGIVADLAFENSILRRAFEREMVERLHADAALARTRRASFEQRHRRPEVTS